MTAAVESHRGMRWLTYPLLAFAVTRLIIFGAGFLGSVMIPAESGHWVADPDSAFLNTWAKWDSQYYVDIATDGYWYQPEQRSNVAFFPLYPILMRITAKFLGGNLILAGFVVSNLAFLAGLIYLFLLTELELDTGSAQRVVFYLAIFPTSFFYSSVYTESVFLLLSVACMYYARRRAWAAAALFGLLASTTRNLGVLLWGLVLWEWLRVQGWRIAWMFRSEAWAGLLSGLRQRWVELLVISIIPFGLLSYMAFLQQNFERPLAFIETQSAFGRENIGPVAVIQKNVTAIIHDEVNKGWMTRVWNTITLLLFLALIPYIWIKFGEGYAIFALLQLLVPASSTTGSIIRYVLTIFPAFMLIADWGRHRWFDRTLSTAFAVLLGVFTILFASWIFVA
jgi:Gpi18-like mannosyltransferase